jgi:hypothetical protein
MMRREWFEPLETSMSALGVATVWLGENLDSYPPEFLQDLNGLVVELSSEVAGTVGEDMAWGLPVAGVPVAPDSSSIAQSLGIPTILWGEEEAREWLTGLGSGHTSVPAPLIAVWGSAGAPGATTLAVGIARELANYRPVVLIDADFVAPSVAQLMGLTGDSLGLLGALRVARNDTPPWESVLACAEPVANSSALHVLSGIRAGGLGRLEAGAMSVLLDTIRGLGVAVVVEGKCSLGAPELTPEKTAVDGIVSAASRVFWVSTSTDLGVSRLVRDWKLLSELTDDADNSILLRAPERSDGGVFTQAAEALWGFTGCSDIRSLPDSKSQIHSAWLPELLSGLQGAGQSPISPPRAPRVGFGPSLRALLTKARSEPLP